MNCFNRKSKSARTGEANDDQSVDLVFDDVDDRWIIDLEIDNIITNISETRTRKLGDEEKLETLDQSYCVNFAVMQRMYLRQLKSKLARYAVEIRCEPAEPDGWQDTLKEYIQALQNYEYMGKFSSQPEDPFYMSGENYLDRHALKEIIGDNADSFRGKPFVNSRRNWQKKPEDTCLIRDTRKDNYLRNWNKGFYQRLGVAAVGGIFLIVPMWLMVLHNTLWTGLVSTTLFVTVFGLMAAAFLESSVDVMSSTAAYAAVLVVFVGLNI